jgi:hypothetical protein
MNNYWRHKKRGTVYEVLGSATMQTEDWGHDNASVVVYRGEDGMLWVRPTAEFMDGRFEAAPPPAETDTRLHVLEGLIATHFHPDPERAKAWLSALDTADPLRGRRVRPNQSGEPTT